MSAATVIKKNVYYKGRVEYRKDWLTDDKAVKKAVVVKKIKQVFDTEVYQGPRHHDTTPRNRHLNIILAEIGTGGFTTPTGVYETVWCSIMMHAYKKGDLEEAVFESHKTSAGQPIHIHFNIAENVKGWMVEVEDAATITRLQDRMKNASTEGCDTGRVFLQTIGYDEQNRDPTVQQM